MKQPVTPERFAELGRRKRLAVAPKGKAKAKVQPPRRTSGTLWSHWRAMDRSTSPDAMAASGY